MAVWPRFVRLAPCPIRDSWSRRDRWATAPGELFPFRILCPRCGGESDVAEVEYRLGALAPAAQTCDRCSAPMPAPDDPVYDDWALVPGEHGRAGEVVCPRCILLPELAARIGWEREHGYRWRQ
jgi:hypothetical protein